MTTARQQVKRILPAPIWAVGSGTYWWWRNRGRHSWARLTNPDWRASLRRVRSFENVHRGRRCFIIGNGPSLKQMDLGKLRNEFTFGLNRIYLLFPELGFTTTYLVSVNDLVLEQCVEEMRQLSIPKFLTWRARRWFHGDPQANFLDTDFTGPEDFSGEMTGRVFEGFTVTYTALQLAFYMGFEQAILIGVDHNFTTQGTPNATIISTGDDPNHFTPGYFGKGFRWQLPDLEGSERAYRLARKAYAEAGRQVLDATVGGKLTVYPKVDYLTLFHG
ncbi:MAG TPA: 6-hydroxymethylpterin diphosphokinase MptE-like protein [Anaerolineales bacterium]